MREIKKKGASRVLRGAQSAREREKSGLARTQRGPKCAKSRKRERRAHLAWSKGRETKKKAMPHAFRKTSTHFYFIFSTSALFE
ncbi:hypothetical protein RYX45_22310, partial [Alkalihalophilus pseudofirmus]